MTISDESIAKLTYEQAFAELEAIVSSLEANQKTLEESLSLFERGQALAAHCAALLDQAELKVRMLSESTGVQDLPGSEDMDS